MDIFALIIALTILFRVVSYKPSIRKTVPRVGILGYHIVYTDQREKNKKENIVYSKLLHCKQHNLTGKPDYIYKSIFGNDLIPVELKSGKVKGRAMPYEGDMFQLICYFLIIEDEYGIVPRYGRLIYDDAMFIIKNLPEYRDELIGIVDEMRQLLATGKLNDEIKTDFAKCRYCLCRTTVCELSDR